MKFIIWRRSDINDLLNGKLLKWETPKIDKRNPGSDAAIVAPRIIMNKKSKPV